MRQKHASVADVLKRALAPELQKRIYSVDFVSKRWRSVVGDEVARRSEPEALDNGVLTVRVTDPVWGRTILKLQGRILPALNRALGGRIVKRINFTRRERLSGEEREAPSKRPLRGEAVAPESVSRAAESIRDETTRAMVLKSAALYLQARNERKRS